MEPHRRSRRHLGAILRLLPICSLPLLSTSLGAQSAGATSQAGLQQQATSIANQILQQSAQLHSLAVQQGEAESALASAKASVTKSEGEVTHLNLELGGARRRLAGAAITEYVDGNSDRSILDFLTSSVQINVVRSDFAKIATTNINDYIIQVQGIQSQLQSEQTVLNTQVAQAQQAVAAVQVAEAAVNTQIQKEDSTLSTIKGQIQTLIQQAIIARAVSENTIQGLPGVSGLQAAASGPAGTVNWGGNPAPPTGAAFAALRTCESNGNYQDDTGNGYYGAYQFSEGTWLNLGFSGYPYEAPASVQDQAAYDLESRSGWGQWPACASVLGLY